MFNAVDNRILYLERIKFAFLTLDGLERGEWRYLTDEEIDTFFPDNEEARQVVEKVFNEILRELEIHEFDIDPFMVLYEPMKHRLTEELDKLGIEY
jgi:hypothetical protein